MFSVTLLENALPRQELKWALYTNKYTTRNSSRGTITFS